MTEKGNPDWTLVDVVNELWSVTENAINKIKDVTSAALNAVKAGLEFIANAVIGPIIDAIVDGFKSIILGIGYTIDYIFPNIPITVNSDGVTIGSNNLKIYREGFDMVLEFFGIKFKTNLLTIVPITKTETLGEGADQAASDSLKYTGIQMLAILVALVGELALKQADRAGEKAEITGNRGSLSAQGQLKKFGFGALIGAIVLLIGTFIWAKNDYDGVINSGELREWKEDYFGEMLENWFFTILGEALILGDKITVTNRFLNAMLHSELAKFVIAESIGIGWEYIGNIDFINRLGIAPGSQKEVQANIAGAALGSVIVGLGAILTAAGKSDSFFSAVFMDYGFLVFSVIMFMVTLYYRYHEI